MRSDGIHLHSLGSYQAYTPRLIAVDTAKPRTQVTFAQIRVGQGSFLRGVYRGQQLVTRYVVVEQVWRREVEASSERDVLDMRGGESGCTAFQGGSQSREGCHVGKLKAVIELVRLPRVQLAVECDAQSTCAMP